MNNCDIIYNVLYHDWFHSIHCDICSGNAVLSLCQKLIFPKYRFIPTIDKGSGIGFKWLLI